jgi:hypothetical protein
VVGSHNQENGEQARSQGQNSSTQTMKSSCVASYSEPLLFLVSKNAPTISVVCGSRHLHKVVLPDFLSWSTAYFQQLYISSDDIHGNNSQPAMISLHIVRQISSLCTQPTSQGSYRHTLPSKCSVNLSKQALAIDILCHVRLEPRWTIARWHLTVSYHVSRHLLDLPRHYSEIVFRPQCPHYRRQQ